MKPRILQAEQIEKMIRRAKTDRDRAMIVLLWRAGLRCAEACAVTGADLEPAPGGGLRLLVRNGKGGKSRYIGLDRKSAEILSRVCDGDAPLLRTRTGQPVDTSYVRRKLPQIAKSAGIPGRVHPHGLRHSFALDLHRESWSVREIQLALGHSSLETTAVYLVGIGADHIVDAGSRREW